jgi:hypothetical protein
MVEMEHGAGDDAIPLVETREDLRARLDLLSEELVVKRNELTLMRTQAEQAARAREASTPELDRSTAWKEGLDAGALTGVMAELALRRSMLYAEASLAQLRLMTVQNQVERLEWRLRQLERAVMTAG